MVNCICIVLFRVWDEAKTRPKPGLFSPTQARPDSGLSKAQGREFRKTSDPGRGIYSIQFDLN
jgi:hypothetical protein